MVVASVETASRLAPCAHRAHTCREWVVGSGLETLAAPGRLSLRSSAAWRLSALFPNTNTPAEGARSPFWCLAGPENTGKELQKRTELR